MARTYTAEYPQPIELHHPQRLSQLALWAIVGQVILLTSAWLLPAVSEYSFVGDNVSELALGRFGLIQTIALALVGLVTLGLAWAIRRLTVGLWGSATGALLVGIYGISGLLAAIFPTDRIDTPDDLLTLSTTGMIHSGAALIGLLCVIIGMFVLTRTFMQVGWRTFARWLVLLPASALALFFVQGEGPLVGILQRALVTVIALWLLAVAFKVRSVAVAAEAGGP